MDYNILVHYVQEKGYFAARKEIERTIISLGDKKAAIDKLQDGYVIGVKTTLEAKEVIQELKEMAFKNPGEFNATEKWIPIDSWCPAGLTAIQKEIKEMKQQIRPGERWMAEVETWQRTPTAEEIIHLLKNEIKENYVEERGTKVVFIEFQGEQAAISILKQDDSFTVVPL